MKNRSKASALSSEGSSSSLVQGNSSSATTTNIVTPSSSSYNSSIALNSVDASMISNNSGGISVNTSNTASTSGGTSIINGGSNHHQKTNRPHLDDRQVVELYFGNLHNNMRLIEKSELEKYLFDKNSILPGREEVIAMFAAMKATWEQSLGYEGAEETAKEARTLMGLLFDEHSNYYVACAYGFLAYYEVGCGRFKTARFYIQCIDFYFKEMSEQETQNMTLYQSCLKKFTTYLTMLSKTSGNMIETTLDWVELYEKYMGISLPIDWKLMVSQDLTEFNYMAIIKVIEVILDIGGIHLKDSPGLTLKNYTVVSSIIFHSLRIKMLTSVNRERDKIEESALRIIEATESEIFIILPPLVVTPIMAACKIHLYIVTLIEKGERKNCDESSPLGPIDYYMVLAKGLRAVKLLGKRFPRVNLYHRNMIQEMESILEKKAFYNSLSELINSFNTHSMPSSYKVPGFESNSQFFRFISNEMTSNNHQPSIEQRRLYENSISTLLSEIQHMSAEQEMINNNNNTSTQQQQQPTAANHEWDDVQQLFNTVYTDNDFSSFLLDEEDERK
ncbi:predicted protein [Naegleria gruberi]|uniref:Predicted protein n=1 Tax=Naegleria gruberi TaxID=5762 RepID=D2VCT7_NAEGR|nr:uncharacterized protein NAEGRDRAFT_48505 [Naegleria gruberi]EFC45363.1 predicted protein [Naegleria gruberi]|eukprot:XP_002678107.1 predicted protein [Naegleria gruberi strain NEG-M]